MMIRSATTLIFYVAMTAAFAQPAHKFSKGLIAMPLHQYGREVLVKDRLAHAWATGNIVKPEQDKAVLPGDTVVWRAIEADSSGAFRGDKMGSGYLYLTYESAVDRTALLNVAGHSMVFFNGEPHAGDIYKYGWLRVPVRVRKGLNQMYVRCSLWSRRQGITAQLIFDEKPIALQAQDATLPNIVLGRHSEPLVAGIVVVNSTSKNQGDLRATVMLAGKTIETVLPSVPPMTLRKVPVQLDASAVSTKGPQACTVKLFRLGKQVDETTITIEAVQPGDHHANTFVSAIDGSVQYYAVAPSTSPAAGQALFFSVHGAEVEAINQARAYDKKDWGTVVAPTNRRPRGFNWEDWGRMDALEVLDIARKKYQPDPNRIYLTGHSMGGHGTWYLGATYPDYWAAIAPCAGYPTLTGYGSADGKIPVRSRSDMEQMLLRTSNGSNVLELVENYKPLGIYIHHGDSDKVVSVDYARQMRKILGEFHKDFSYYEYPGGSHWFGDESVDWPPIFQYFQWHKRAADTAVHNISFRTANPAVSSSYRWVSIVQQQHPLQYSTVNIVRDSKRNTIRATTDNVALMALSLEGFRAGESVILNLDGEALTVTAGSNQVFLQRYARWQVGAAPAAGEKGTERGGTFKEPFNHRMVFVYGTGGSAEENAWLLAKAKYDAEVWYYRGNGAVDLVPDKSFHAKAYADRGVVLYGNASNNAAWATLLKNCPIQISKGSARVGAREFKGSDLGAYFMWPRADSRTASVAVISGTGMVGFKATEGNQYFAAGSGFPDYTIFSVDMLKDGVTGVRAAGFYSNDWSVEKGEQAVQ